MCKEGFVAWFKVLLQHLSKGTEKIQWFDPGASWIRIMNASTDFYETCYTTLLWILWSISLIHFKCPIESFDRFSRNFMWHCSHAWVYVSYSSLLSFQYYSFLVSFTLIFKAHITFALISLINSLFLHVISCSMCIKLLCFKNLAYIITSVMWTQFKYLLEFLLSSCHVGHAHLLYRVAMHVTTGDWLPCWWGVPWFFSVPPGKVWDSFLN